MANVPRPELSLEGHHMIAFRLKRGHRRISACVLLLPQNSELRTQSFCIAWAHYPALRPSESVCASYVASPIDRVRFQN